MPMAVNEDRVFNCLKHKLLQYIDLKCCAFYLEHKSKRMRWQPCYCYCDKSVRNLTKYVDQETHNSRSNSYNVQTIVRPSWGRGGGGGTFVPSLNFKNDHFEF